MQNNNDVVECTDHKYEFHIAAHGSQVFRCITCNDIIDVFEDSQP